MIVCKKILFCVCVVATFYMSSHFNACFQFMKIPPKVNDHALCIFLRKFFLKVIDYPIRVFFIKKPNFVFLVTTAFPFCLHRADSDQILANITNCSIPFSFPMNKVPLFSKYQRLCE